MIPDAAYIKLGQWEFPSPDAPRVKVVVEFSGKGKVDKKESDGKSDAKTTWKGRAPCDVKITLTWPEWDWNGQTVEDVYVRRALKELNPRGPKGGEPWEVTHIDAELFDVAAVMFESMPLKRTEATSQLVAELSGASWVKPPPDDKGKAKTATDPNNWQLGHPKVGTKAPIVRNGFGGPSSPGVKP